MPTYEYACTKCGQHVEVFQHVSDEPLKDCGVCGGPLRKVFHPAGILFKGSGFYSTDNRAKPSGEKSSGGETSKTPEKSSSEKSSSGDTKKSGDPGSSKSAGDSVKKDSNPSGPKERSA